MPSPFPEEGAISGVLADLLRSLGLRARLQRVGPGRSNVLATLGRGRCLLLLGHLDTVPPEPGWREPFRLRHRGGMLLGLGAHDMKGGIACLLAALYKAERTHPLKVALTVDEEGASAGAHAMAWSGFLDDVAGCVSLESAGHTRPEEVCLGRRGRAVLEVEVVGRAAHAASPELGVNAVSAAAPLLGALPRVPLASHPRLGRGSIAPLSIRAEARGLTIPDRCTLVLDRHIVPPETPASALEGLRSSLPPPPAGARYVARLSERPTPFLLPYWTDPRSRVARVLGGAVRAVTGRAPVWTAGRSVADENVVGAMGIPTVVHGPLGGGDHTRGEWVDAASLGAVRDVLVRALEAWEPP